MRKLRGPADYSSARRFADSALWAQDALMGDQVGPKIKDDR
jgi:hypothetical protein